jgi:hypothetical protein
MPRELSGPPHLDNVAFRVIISRLGGYIPPVLHGTMNSMSVNTLYFVWTQQHHVMV